MRTRLLIAAICFTASCQSNDSQQNIKAFHHSDDSKKASQSRKDTFTTVYTECDSTKLLGFKKNLSLITTKSTFAFKESVRKIANAFVAEQCKQDTIFCNPITLYKEFYYQDKLGNQLFSFAYRFSNTQTGFEKESASLFVYGIKKGNTILNYNIAEDLVGEIKLDLAGFEIKGDSKIIWGEMYPYFSHEYGKFKLSITKNNKKCEFQCHTPDNTR